MIKCLIRVYVWICSFGLTAQSAEVNQASVGTGPFVSTEQSQWALFRNMAGLAESDSWGMVLAYHYPYNLKELQSLAWGIIIPSKPKLGISIFQSGSNLLLNQQIALCIAKKFDGLNLGLRVKYWRLTVTGYDHLASLSMAVGIQVKLTKKLVIGSFLSNITQNQIGNEELLPTVWFTGISYDPSPKLQLILEIGHNLGYTWDYKLGFDYKFKEKISVRSGLNSSNRQGHFGLGFHTDKIQLDYALGIHFLLGISHQAGLSYSWP